MSYGIALLATGVALGLSLVLLPAIRSYIFPELFLAAVAGSAWYGGIGPGLLATLASAAASLYFLLPSLGSWSLAEIGAIAQLGLLTLTAVLVTRLRGVVGAARARVEASRVQAQSQERRVAFLANASGVLRASLDHETTLEAVVGLAVPFLADCCALDLLEPDGRIRRRTRAPGREMLVHELDERYPLQLDGPHPMAKVLRTGRAELVPEISESLLAQIARNEEHLALLRRFGPRSAMCVPLLARERILGAMTFVITDSPRRYGADDLDFAEDVGRRCATAIDNARLYREAQDVMAERLRAEQRLALQYATTRILADCEKLEEAAAPILRAVCECLGWVHGGLWRVEAAAGVLRCVGTWTAPGVAAEFGATSRERAFAPGVGLPGRVWATGEAAWIPDVAEDTNFPRAVAAAKAGLHAAFGFPIRAGIELLGVIEFFNPRIMSPDDAVIAMIATVGSQIGQFMQRARATEERTRLLAHLQTAHAEARAAERRAGFLADATAALSASLDPPEIYERLARLAVPYLADWCTIDVPAEGGSVRRMAAAHTEPAKEELLRGHLDHYRPPPSHPFRETLHSGQSILVPVVADVGDIGVTFGGEHHDVVRELAIRSFLLVPLVARGRGLGAIVLASATPGRFGAADLALAEDLAQRGALALDNARLYGESQDATRRKDEFLAMLGHELRNPLAAIRGAVQVLDRVGAQTEPAIRQRAIIDRQTRHLSRLVDDLLDVSRVVSGKIVLQRQAFELNEIAARCAQSLVPRAEARQQQLVLTPAEEAVVVDGDPVRVEQVLFNLLDNAIKYTPAGGRVELAIERVEAEAVVRVRDSGIGISSELLPRVFDMFAQAERSLDRAQGGLGLGLTLVRRLVEQHGGSVAVRSAGPDQGSEFVVSLPIHLRSLEVPSDGQRRPEPRPVPTRVPPRHILLVEDNADGREALRVLLELSGHRVDVAEDGPSGIEAARRAAPEVALVDIGLPGVDGYQVASALRARQGRRIRLIALTGYGQADDRRRALEAGFDAHLVKPVDPDELARLLADVSPADAA